MDTPENGALHARAAHVETGKAASQPEYENAPNENEEPKAHLAEFKIQAKLRATPSALPLSAFKGGVAYGEDARLAYYRAMAAGLHMNQVHTGRLVHCGKVRLGGHPARWPVA